MGLKLSFLLKLIVRAGSGVPESSLSYAEIGLGCWGIPTECFFFTDLIHSPCIYTQLLSINAFNTYYLEYMHNVYSLENDTASLYLLEFLSCWNVVLACSQACQKVYFMRIPLPMLEWRYILLKWILIIWSAGRKEGSLEWHLWRKGIMFVEKLFQAWKMTLFQQQKVTQDHDTAFLNMV